MNQRENRKELILEAAQELFMRQGYAATSVRQIADVVGCTEAALYYHFPAGKRSLLQAALENKVPEIQQTLAHCRAAESLPELVRAYLRDTVAGPNDERQHQLRWLIMEFPQFTAEERTLVHGTLLNIHRELRQLVAQFVPGRPAAESLTWLLICATLGYMQIFHFLGLAEAVDFPPIHLAEWLTPSLK